MGDLEWSYSRYSLALQCLRKFKLIEIDKLKPAELESGDMAFGTAIHIALNSTLEGVDGQTAFDTVWSNYEGQELVYGRFKWDQLGNIGRELLRKFDKQHKHRYEPAVMEQRLIGEYKGIRLAGTVDFYGLVDGIPTLVDFKTAGYPYKREKIDCSLQLYLYAYLLKTCLDKHPNQVSYLPMVKSTGSIQGPLILELDEKKMYSALDEMVDYLSLLEKQDSWPKNYNSCVVGTQICPFFNRCHEVKNAED